jgi:hypothetical protein
MAPFTVSLQINGLVEAFGTRRLNVARSGRMTGSACRAS